MVGEAGMSRKGPASETEPAEADEPAVEATQA